MASRLRLHETWGTVRSRQEAEKTSYYERIRAFKNISDTPPSSLASVSSLSELDEDESDPMVRLKKVSRLRKSQAHLMSRQRLLEDKLRDNAQRPEERLAGKTLASGEVMQPPPGSEKWLGVQRDRASAALRAAGEVGVSPAKRVRRPKKKKGNIQMDFRFVADHVNDYAKWIKMEEDNTVSRSVRRVVKLDDDIDILDLNKEIAKTRALQEAEALRRAREARSAAEARGAVVDEEEDEEEDEDEEDRRGALRRMAGRQQRRSPARGAAGLGRVAAPKPPPKEDGRTPEERFEAHLRATCRDVRAQLREVFHEVQAAHARGSVVHGHGYRPRNVAP